MPPASFFSFVSFGQPLLAEAPPQNVDPSFLGQWVLAAGVMLTLLLQIRQYQDRNKKQQREIVGDSITVKRAAEPASSDELSRVDNDVKSIERGVREDVSTLHKKIDDLHNHVASSERRVLEAGEERITRLQTAIATLEASLHNRITDIASQAARLEGMIEVIRANKK